MSFETLDVAGEAVETQVARLENRGSAAADYVMSLDLLGDTPGAQFVLPAQGVITVPARGVHDVAVSLNADAASMKRRHDPSVDEVQREELRHWLSEESGYLVFEPAGGGPRLRVPLFAALRAASAMYAAREGPLTDPLQSATTP